MGREISDSHQRGVLLEGRALPFSQLSLRFLFALSKLRFKWIRVLTHFQPAQYQVRWDFLELNSYRLRPKFRARNKKCPSCVYLLHKSSHQEILRHVRWQQRNVPKVWCKCRVVLFALWNQLIFCRSRCRRLRRRLYLNSSMRIVVESRNIGTSIMWTTLYGGPLYGPSPPLPSPPPNNRPDFLQCWTL